MFRLRTAVAGGVSLMAAVVVGCSTASDETAMPDSAAGVAEAPAAHDAATHGLLDPNTATADQLRSVGMDSAAIAALTSGRPYQSMTAVDKALANHLSDARRDSVYAHLFIPINLNTATAEEILMIPGVGPRMRHEFEEYRPYTSMAQFRREIGKYVDQAEVARLERYVKIED